MAKKSRTYSFQGDVDKFRADVMSGVQSGSAHKPNPRSSADFFKAPARTPSARTLAFSRIHTPNQEQIAQHEQSLAMDRRRNDKKLVDTVARRGNIYSAGSAQRFTTARDLKANKDYARDRYGVGTGKAGRGKTYSATQAVPTAGVPSASKVQAPVANPLERQTRTTRRRTGLKI